MRVGLLLRSLVISGCIAILLAGCVQQGYTPESDVYLAAPTPRISPINRPGIVRYLEKGGVQVVQRGGMLRILLPTDHFFIGQTTEVNPDCFPLLTAVANLIQTYTCCGVPYVWVTAYTDEVGTTKAKKERSEQQAQIIAAFLWANYVPARIMNIKGFADRERISSNRIVGGSADNRRIEIGIPEPFIIQGW
ncbi:MAG: OmpA family protein [Gammaproteobacteria bacterium]